MGRLSNQVEEEGVGNGAMILDDDLRKRPGAVR